MLAKLALARPCAGMWARLSALLGGKGKGAELENSGIFHLWARSGMRVLAAICAYLRIIAPNKKEIIL